MPQPMRASNNARYMGFRVRVKIPDNHQGREASGDQRVDGRVRLPESSDAGQPDEGSGHCKHRSEDILKDDQKGY